MAAFEELAIAARNYLRAHSKDQLAFPIESRILQRLEELRSPQYVTTLTGHMDRVLALAVKGDHLFSGSGDTTIRVWSTTDFKHVTTLTDHMDWVFTLAVKGDHLFSGSSDKTIRVWSTTDFKHVTTLTGHMDWVLALA